MDVARISVKGQVTIPIEIRKKLGLKEGDKVIFIEKSGDIVLMNSNRLAFEEFQRDMAGEALRAGLNSEDDVADLVKQIREKMWEAQRAGND
ncbi:MAG: AbrB/MazE/SpoVT family DNA-binding domain-containing protein [Clostridiales Family XIII bacterium]|nr:AbrB/MazE/SpoVT family DNA-binding domain-containing protein [Clostridiales Family XIII bacterium]